MNLENFFFVCMQIFEYNCLIEKKISYTHNEYQMRIIQFIRRFFSSGKKRETIYNKQKNHICLTVAIIMENKIPSGVIDIYLVCSFSFSFCLVDCPVCVFILHQTHLQFHSIRIFGHSSRYILVIHKTNKKNFVKAI